MSYDASGKSINESLVSRESLPDLVKAAMNDLDPPNAMAAPEICMLSQYGDFLAYRVRFESEVEYHFDVEGNQIEKPMRYATHGGVV